MITADLLAAYTTTRYELDALKLRVDSILSLIAGDRDGLYISRIKTPDSIFDKMIIGKYAKPLVEMEDLLAATIVLSNTPVGDAQTEFEEALRERFDIVETRSNRTRRPDEFIYDDLHYILRLKDSPFLLNRQLLNLNFELQVKSYLQYGWSKATHNSIYKSGNESWRASRVAAQTRALVEMVEATLAVGESILPETSDRVFEPIDNRVMIAGLISEWWKGDLPRDRRRLSLFTSDFLKITKLVIRDFEELLNSARGQELCDKTSISVQQAILILLIEFHGDKLIDQLQQRGDRFLVITSEMEAQSEKCKTVPASVRVSLTPV